MSESAQNEMREKEARVHEELFGCKVQTFTNPDGKTYSFSEQANCLTFDNTVPRYGSDSAAMMAIIEKFQLPRIKRFECFGVYRWLAEFVDRRYLVIGEGYGDTMQEAVLNAAIAWLDAKKEGQE